MNFKKLLSLRDARAKRLSEEAKQMEKQNEAQSREMERRNIRDEILRK